MIHYTGVHFDKYSVHNSVPGHKVTNMEELKGSGPFTVKTSVGETLEVDMVISCTGIHVNSSAYLQGLGKLRLFFFNIFVYFTSLREQDKAYINSL